MHNGEIAALMDQTRFLLRMVFMAFRSPSVPVLLCLVAAPVLWGGNFLVGDVLVSDLPGVWANFLRWIIALVVILPFCGASLIRHRTTLIAHWRNLTILATLGVTLFNLILYVALKHAPVALAAVAFAATPFLTSGLSAICQRERPSTRLMVGASIAIAGMVLAQWQTLRLGTPVIGVVLVALAAIVWSGYCVAIRLAPVPAPASAVLPAQIIVGLIPMFPIILVSGPFDAGSLEPSHWIGLAYLGVFAGAVAFWLWRDAVLVVGPGYASPFMNLVPISIVTLGVAFLGVRLTPVECLAFALVLSGLGLASRHASPVWASLVRATSNMRIGRRSVRTIDGFRSSGRSINRHREVALPRAHKGATTVAPGKRNPCPDDVQIHSA
jgi:drug/metabolite transporter (DMT)-like permease